MSRVVVVGGGFGGMAAAARLAKLGHQVTLADRRDRLGGSLGFVERDGFRWDSGPTATALPAVVRDLFRKSGRPLERELELVPVEPMREHRFADGTALAMPAGSRAAQLEAVREALGVDAARSWVAYVAGFADTWDSVRRGYLERPYSPAHVERATTALLRTRTSLSRHVRRSLTDARLREVAVFSTWLEGQQARDVPAWLGMWAYLEQNFGAWTVTGGMGELANALARRLTQRKVAVMTGVTVRDLLTSDGHVLGVRTDAGDLDADVVVVAADPARMPALARHSRRTTPALPPRATHLGLVGDVGELPREVVLHGDPVLVVRTGGTAPDGGTAWTVLSRGDEDVVPALARRGLDVTRQVRVRVDRSATDQVEELGGSPAGVLWHGRATTDHKLARPPIAGVYLAGAHGAAGPSLPFVGLASAVVAEQVGRA